MRRTPPPSIGGGTVTIRWRRMMKKPSQDEHPARANDPLPTGIDKEDYA
jgi:hypothetical protein